MKVAVLGLWHLGSVTAACAAAAGHEVVGWDPDPATVSRLMDARPPVAETGLTELLTEQLGAGRLRFTADLADAVRDAAIVWVAFDTPVDQDDRADVASVVQHVEAAFPFLADGALVLCSSQMPVGTVRRLERTWQARDSGHGEQAPHVGFACSPENLRLGKAIEVFMRPDRVVVGARTDRDRETLTMLFAPITSAIEWMSVESAEMTKHAVNAFLATSVAFINELATLCEATGADAKDVERGLKTERRIGPYAYLSPGAAFAGGTLARDVVFLREMGQKVGRATPLMDGIEASNLSHRRWAHFRLQAELGSVSGRRIAIWGLTYKPGTSTLRRSTAVELCRWLLEHGADVRAHDPAAGALPADLHGVVRVEEALDAVEGAAALVVATEWPAYRAIDVERLAAAMPAGLVLDANSYLAPTLGGDRRFRVVGVGRPSK
jgi:UDPglucose 6-dehydrogenase